MSKIRMPALHVGSLPGRRELALDLAKDIERRGFSGLFTASFGDAMGFCLSLALTTERMIFGTSIANIYMRLPSDYASSAGAIHELSGGRFRFGVGVSHGPLTRQLGVPIGKPLNDMRQFIEHIRATPGVGDLPPIILATLRSRMIALASEIGQGMVFANGARSHMKDSLSVLSQEQRDSNSFFIGNMIPTCISEDIEAAAAVNRRTMSLYLSLPNYRNYWREAGYEDEMAAVEAALERGDTQIVSDLVSDRWLSDVTLYGPPSRVMEGLEAWYDAGIRTPIIVPSSTTGRQSEALHEVFDLFVKN